MSTIKAKAFQHPSATSNNITFNADGTHTLNAANPIINKNLLINGGMNVWQRSTSTSVSTDTYSTVDRWKTRVSTMGVFTISRSTDVPSAQGFGYSTKWDCTTADASPAAGDFIVFQQAIEGQNLQHLLKGTSDAKKLTLSFWVKSNKTGTYIVNIIDDDNTRTIAKAYTIDTASTWQKVELTFDGDTTGTLDNNNASSLRLQWWFGAGTDWTSGTLATSWESTTNANKAVGQVNLADSTSNELYITGCQLEVGEQATVFEFEPIDKIEQKCFRYYYHTRQVNGSTYPGCSFAHGISSSRYASGTQFPVTMRASPSVTIRRPSDNVAGDAHQYLGVDGSGNQTDVNLGTVNVIDRGRTGFPYFTVTAGGNTGGGLLFHYEASAEL